MSTNQTPPSRSTDFLAGKPHESIRKDSQITRKRLIDTAETLFAGRGIDNVSLVDIARSAGQKNRNALQYHFGGKAQLIEAVLDKHGERIAAHRRKMLDALNGKRRPDLRCLVEILVLPVVAQMENPDGGACFIKINGQLMSNASFAEQRIGRAHQLPEVAELEAMLLEHVGDIPIDALKTRMLLIDCLLFQGLASYLSRPFGIPKDVFVTELISAIVALIARPD